MSFMYVHEGTNNESIITAVTNILIKIITRRVTLYWNICSMENENVYYSFS